MELYLRLRHFTQSRRGRVVCVCGVSVWERACTRSREEREMCAGQLSATSDRCAVVLSINFGLTADRRSYPSVKVVPDDAEPGVCVGSQRPGVTTLLLRPRKEEFSAARQTSAAQMLTGVITGFYRRSPSVSLISAASEK